MNTRKKSTVPLHAATLQVHVGSIADMGDRFAAAWRRAEAGEDTRASHLTFLDLETLISTLSLRRLELLRKVRRQGGYPSIRALAQALGRDYKNVHADVAVLLSAGLLEQRGRRLVAPWASVQASLDLG